MLPWSVMAMAPMPSSEVRAKRPSRSDAPSSIEYSVWTCRCTNDDSLDIDAGPPQAIVGEDLQTSGAPRRDGGGAPLRAPLGLVHWARGRGNHDRAHDRGCRPARRGAPA